MILSEPDGSIGSNPLEAVKLHGKNQARNGWRSTLEILFVAIATATVTLAFSASRTLATQSTQPLYGLSPNMLTISSIPASSNGIDYGQTANSLTLADATVLSNPDNLPTAEFVAPVTFTTTKVQYALRSTTTRVVGTTSSYASATGFTVAEGRFLSVSDLNANSPVAVLGATVASELFGTLDPVGQQITISGAQFQVVGVLNRMGFSGADDLDNRIVIPETSFWHHHLSGGGEPINEILVRSTTPALARQAAQQAETILLEQHSIYNPTQADFSIISHTELAASILGPLRTLKRTFSLMALILLILATLHLSQSSSTHPSNRGDHLPDTKLDIFSIFHVTWIGVVGSGIGVLVGTVVIPILRLLVPGTSNLQKLTIEDIGLTLVIGVAFSVISLLPRALGITDHHIQLPTGPD